MQKILLFVLVILIVNVQSVDVYTQASINKLVTDAQAVSAAAKAQAAVSKQANTDAQAVALADKNLLPNLKQALDAALLAQKNTQDSFNLQNTATTAAQATADTNKNNLVAAHALVDANVVVVSELNARKTAMAWTPTQLTKLETDRSAFSLAVANAGTSVTAVQTKLTSWLSGVTDKKNAINQGTLNAATSAAKGQADTTATAMGSSGTPTVCKDTLVNAYYAKAVAWIAAGVAGKRAELSLASYTAIIAKVGTDLTAQAAALVAKQVAVKDAANALTYNLNDAASVLGQVQQVINAEQARVAALLVTANAATLTLATGLQNANSVATSSDSVWLSSKQLLATQQAALTSASSKAETQQSLYDARYKSWMTTQNAAYATGLTEAQQAASAKMALDMVTLGLEVQGKVNAALTTDVASAAAALQVVVTKAAATTAAVAAQLKTVTDAAAAAAAAGVTSMAAAVKAGNVAQLATDNTLGTKWNKSLTADAVAAKAACAAKVKAAKDANKSSTKLNFSVLSLIAGLLIMTMN